MTHAKIQYVGGLRVICTDADSHAKIEMDAPQDLGGSGNAFSPTDLIGVSLASCMIITMGLAAKKLGFDLEGTVAEVEKQMAVGPVRRIGKLVVRIRCPKLPNPQIREKLEQAAMHCPVHASLHPDTKQEIDFVWGL